MPNSNAEDDSAFPSLRSEHTAPRVNAAQIVAPAIDAEIFMQIPIDMVASSLILVWTSAVARDFGAASKGNTNATRVSYEPLLKKCESEVVESTRASYDARHATTLDGRRQEEMGSI
jgi:hypothetical protein